MPRHVHVVVRLERLADDVGLWCPACNLPSGIRRTYAMATGKRLSVGRAAICFDCGGVLDAST